MPRKLKAPIPTGVSAYADPITVETVSSYPKRAPGRPASILDARRVNAWLDPKTIASLLEIGCGNLSAGIRIAAIATDPRTR